MNYDRLLQLGGIDREVPPIPGYITKDELKKDIDDINSKIPEGASAENKLATEQYVNETSATDSATFRGSFNLVTDLSLSVSATQAQIATALASAISNVDNNDYCYVQVPVADDKPTEIDKTERYKFNGTSWAFEFNLTTVLDVKGAISDVIDTMTMDETEGDITIQYDNGR